MMDAGSSCLVGNNNLEKEDFKETQISTIVEKIKAYTPSNKKDYPIQLNILVSHGDSDHYNWIVDILSNFNQKDLCVRFLLGGNEKDYGKKLKKTIKKFATKDPLYKEYIDDYENLTDIPAIQCENATCTLLAAQKTANTNRNSIVVKIVRGDFSIILTGDATSKTTDEIIERYSTNLRGLETTVLQASHHGADSHGSNSVEWIEATKPSYIVISAGERLDYRHPRQLSIENFIKSSQLKRDASIHFLHYYADMPLTDYHVMLEEPYTFARLETGCVVAITQLGIFNTASQGDISFLKDKTISLTKKSLNNSGKDLSSQKELFYYFLKEPRIDQTIALKFPSMDLLSTDIEDLKKRLKLIKLISCDLSRGILKDGCVEKLPVFINGLKYLRDLKLPPLTLEQRKIIESAWEHRGLSFN